MTGLATHTAIIPWLIEAPVLGPNDYTRSFVAAKQWTLIQTMQTPECVREAI